MDLLITDTVVVTCDAQRRILENAAVAVQGDRITALGEVPATWSGAFRRISLAVLPGFINAHTHTALTRPAQHSGDLDSNPVYGYMSPVSYEMSDEERAIMVQLGCLEATRSGCATLVDPFRHLHSYVPAMAATGLRLSVSESCADINTLKIRRGDYTVDRAFGQVFLDRTMRVIEDFMGRTTTGCAVKSRRMRRTTARPGCSTS